LALSFTLYLYNPDPQVPKEMGSTSATPTLLVVDLQAALVDPDPEAGPRSTPNLKDNVAKLLSYWRSRKWPVIHVYHDPGDAEPDHPLNRKNNPEGFAPHSCAAPLDSEPKLYKNVGSAFQNPESNLAFRLLKHGGQNAPLTVIGMDGAQCINDNARSGQALGFDVTVVADACAAFGMEDWRGGKGFDAEETHRAAMSMLANGFARVVGTEEYLGELEGR
jgi:nicotinamidase-related amidase